MGKAKNFVFEICQQKSKARCMYLAFKHLKISNKKVKSVQKGKTKAQIMFLEVKTQKRNILLMHLQVKFEHTAEITYLKEAKNKEGTP